MVWLTEYLNHSRFRGLVIRKNADDLADWLDRAARMYRLLRVKIAYRPAVLTFPSGAVVRTGHLKDEQSYNKYLGQEFHRILIEELTQIPNEKRYLQLIASCRTTVDGLEPQVFATTNPGGLGHLWVKQRFVDPAPMGKVFTRGGRTRVYISATVDDNPTLIKKDPDYVKSLDNLKEIDEELWKAWRLGDWNTFAGQYFKEFRRDVHTTKPFTPKDDLPKFGGIDWGYSPRPFVFLAGALERVKHFDDNLNEYNFNRMWIYREIQGTEKTPQVWAKIIKEKLVLKQFSWIRGDPSMNIRRPDGSRSILNQFQEEGISIQPANNDRINGWVAVRNWLTIAPDGLPYLLISEQCHNLITNLPTLVHDENRVEDLSSDGDDDQSDSLRYMLIHSKWVDGKLGTVQRKTQQILSPKFVHLVDLDKFK